MFLSFVCTLTAVLPNLHCWHLQGHYFVLEMLASGTFKLVTDARIASAWKHDHTQHSLTHSGTLLCVPILLLYR